MSGLAWRLDKHRCDPAMADSCYHKPVIGCALVALAGCCACADKRPIAASYPVYIDGQGMRMQGKRWSRYCWKCRGKDYLISIPVSFLSLHTIIFIALELICQSLATVKYC